MNNEGFGKSAYYEYLEARRHEQNKAKRAGDREKEIGKKTWVTYDSSLIDMSRHFNNVLPQEQHESNKGFKDYIEDYLGNKKGLATAVELGGPGSKLFSGFDEGFFAKTIGITLADLRSQKEKGVDTERHHEVLVGDIFSPMKYQECKNSLGGGADLIIERMLGGLTANPKSTLLYGKILDRWYQLLNENGLMFIRSPEALIPYIDKLSQNITNNFSDKLEIDTHKECFRLIKLPGAPKNLPF